MQKYLAPAFTFLAFVLLACQPLASRQTSNITVDELEITGIWIVETLGDRAVIERSPARIQFAEDGAINGNASCNRFFGKYTYEQTQLQIHPLGSTRMMCLPHLMEQEERLLELLPTAQRITLDGDSLTLFNAAGVLLIKATRDLEQ